MHIVDLILDPRGEWRRMVVRTEKAGVEPGIRYEDDNEGRVQRVVITAATAEEARETARAISTKESELRRGAMTRVMAITNGVRL